MHMMSVYDRATRPLFFVVINYLLLFACRRLLKRRLRSEEEEIPNRHSSLDFRLYTAWSRRFRTAERKRPHLSNTNRSARLKNHNQPSSSLCSFYIHSHPKSLIATMFSSSEDATGPSRPQKQPRKINRSQPQLKRNAACLPCRRRRIKCDAAKPHCSSCVRSYHFLARTYPDAERDTRGVQCTYAEDAPDAVHNEQQSQGLRSRLSQPTKRKLSEEDEEDGDPEEMIRKLKGEVGTCFGFIY